MNLGKRDRPLRYWINDLNFDLYCFWVAARDRIDELVDYVTWIYENYREGKILYAELTQTHKDREYSDFDRAVRFFVLNRVTFSGLVESGGYSQGAFEGRFTQSSIQRLKEVSPHLQGVKITHGDYEQLLSDRENAFFFFDPPYRSARKSKLYGKNGNLHVIFDYERLAKILKGCDRPWLVTIDDSPQIRELFSFAHILEWELQYGMNNSKGTAAKGKELFVRNY